jgi:hypothetical protein
MKRPQPSGRHVVRVSTTDPLDSTNNMSPTTKNLHFSRKYLNYTHGSRKYADNPGSAHAAQPAFCYRVVQSISSLTSKIYPSTRSKHFHVLLRPLNRPPFDLDNTTTNPGWRTRRTSSLLVSSDVNLLLTHTPDEIQSSTANKVTCRI